MATQMNLGQLLQSVIDIVKNDTLKVVLPDIQAFFNSIVANPSQLNIVAQFNLLQVKLLSDLPNIEQSVAKDLATLLNAQISALVAAQPKAA